MTYDRVVDVRSAVDFNSDEINDEETGETYCKVIRPITTQSLIALTDADLYLLTVDDEYVDTDYTKRIYRVHVDQ